MCSTALQNSDGKTLEQSLDTWTRKICGFRPKSPFISETVYEIDLWLLWIAKHRKSQVPDGYVSLSMTLSDFERPDVRYWFNPSAPKFLGRHMPTPTPFDLD